MWHLWAWFSGGYGCAGSMVRLNSLRSLFQLKWLCDSKDELEFTKTIPFSETTQLWCLQKLEPVQLPIALPFFLEITQIPTEKPESVPVCEGSTANSCWPPGGVCSPAAALAGPSWVMEHALPQVLMESCWPTIPFSPRERDACPLEASLNYRNKIIRKQILPQCSFKSIFWAAARPICWQPEVGGHLPDGSRSTGGSQHSSLPLFS